MGKTMGVATVIVVGATVLFGMLCVVHGDRGRALGICQDGAVDVKSGDTPKRECVWGWA